MIERTPKPSAVDAETVAIQAIAFIAGDAVLLPRFLALTGIEPEQIRTAALEPGFLAGTLDFILAHEPTLLTFAENSGLAPSQIRFAREALPNGSSQYDRSI